VTIQKPPLIIKAQTAVTNKKKIWRKQFSIWQMELLHPAMWHHHEIDFARWPPCNVAGGSGMTCHWICPNVHYIGILLLFLISAISFCTSLRNFIQIGPPSAEKMMSYRFLPCDAMHSAAIAVTRCPSVRLSVRPSRSWVAPKWIKISWKFFHHRVATPFKFSHTKGGVDIPTGTPLTGALNARGMIKCRFFHKYLAVSQKRLYLDGHMHRDNL